MSYRPGDTFFISFTTQSSTGASADADALPVASLRRNGADDGSVAVVVTQNSTGDYTASASIPLTYSISDDVELVVSAAVAGTSAKAVFPLGKLDRTAQTVAQVVHRSGQVHFITASGDASRDGFSPETAKALPSQPSPNAGDTLLLFTGTFALDTANLDLSGDGSTGVHLVGAGAGATVITSNALLTGPGCIIKPGNGSQLADFTVQATAAIDGSTDQYQAPLGASLTQAPFTGAVARRLHLIGDSDGVYIKKPTSIVSMDAHDCRVQTKYDGVNLYADAASRVGFHDCQLMVSGPSTCNGGTLARAMVSQGGSVEMFGGACSPPMPLSAHAGRKPLPPAEFISMMWTCPPPRPRARSTTSIREEPI